MLKIKALLKRTPRPILVFLFIIVSLILINAFWLLNKSPSPENVFWQTLDNNLNSQSVILETKTEIDLPGSDNRILLDNNLALSFAPEVATKFDQKILSYDQLLASYYVNPQQVDTYGVFGVEDLPPQEWYEQNSYSFNDLIYARHDLYTEPRQDDWRDNFNDGFKSLPLGETWYKKISEEDLKAHFQYFLMFSVASDGFLYGKIEPSARAEIMEELKGAYKIDFETVKSSRKDGRLYYEYDVRLDYGQLGVAFLEYLNANIADEDKKLVFNEEEARKTFAGQQDTNYKVLIDVWARQITQIRYPYMVRPIISQQIDPEDFSISPHFSAIIRDFIINTNLKINVTTNILSQNHRLNLEQPTGAIDLGDQAEESEP